MVEERGRVVLGTWRCWVWLALPLLLLGRSHSKSYWWLSKTQKSSYRPEEAASHLCSRNPSLSVVKPSLPLAGMTGDLMGSLSQIPLTMLPSILCSWVFELLDTFLLAQNTQCLFWWQLGLPQRRGGRCPHETAFLSLVDSTIGEVCCQWFQCHQSFALSIQICVTTKNYNILKNRVKSKHQSLFSTEVLFAFSSGSCPSFEIFFDALCALIYRYTYA